MDAGTNAADILNGRIYPLKLGFIGVVNRSQQDINANLPMKDAMEHESEFFKSHPAYRNIAHRNGTKYLAKTLNQAQTFFLLMINFLLTFALIYTGSAESYQGKAS